MKNLHAPKSFKAIATLLSLCLLLLSLTAPTWADDRVTQNIQKYTDVPADHWASAYITRLTYEGAITGYPAGTFRPSSNITRAEFVAVAVRALLTPPEAPAAGQHWAVNIMKAAQDSNILEGAEFAADTWNTPINRQEMAKIMARAAQFVKKEALAEKTSVYTSKITDFAGIGAAYNSYVAQVYAKGIVGGYPDGSFGGEKPATRAEAAAMLVRLIDPSHRLTVTAAEDPVGITFNPATDVAADGRMKLEKAEQYMMQTLQSLRFYEENGKFYLTGNVAELPEGFRNSLAISVRFKVDSGVEQISPYSSFPLRGDIALPAVGLFKVELNCLAEHIGQIELTLIILATDHTNILYDKTSYEVLWKVNSLYDNRIEVHEHIIYEKKSNKFYDLSTIFLWLKQ